MSEKVLMTMAYVRDYWQIFVDCVDKHKIGSRLILIQSYNTQLYGEAKSIGQWARVAIVPDLWWTHKGSHGRPEPRTKPVKIGRKPALSRES